MMMKTSTILAVLALFVSSAVRAGEAMISIEPDPYVSSDHVTICRVVARNESDHTLQGKEIAFEARAWENGVLVARERGRFAGAVPPGQTAETRIGFDGVFTTFTVEPVEAGASGGRSARKRGAPKGKSKKGSSAKAGAAKKSRTRNRRG
jgi:hypothetical protein